MIGSNGASVLAIGFDSAEPVLVRRMIDQGELPVLKSLLSEGKWIRLDSTAHIGTSSVWPSFTTGEEVGVHGIYSEWCWEPATLDLTRLTGRDLKPFWKALADAGKSVGIVGVPFMPFAGLSNGFEISDTQPHIPTEHRRQSPLNGIADLVTTEMARDALTHGHISVSGPDDLRNLQKLASDSLEGIQLRGKLAEQLLTRSKPDLSIVVFTEAHESGHCLWQTIEPEHHLFSEHHLAKLPEIRPTLKNIYQEVDRQIEKLVRAARADASVLVFSLHGMSPARGVPTFLAPLMCEAGFSPIAKVNSLSWAELAVRLGAAIKRRTPAGLKKLYYKTLPRPAVLRLATPTMLPQYDWTQTRAFSLVNEQNGSIRVNLVGREAKGIVPVEDYVEVCRQVEQWLRTLCSQDGRPLAKQIILTAACGEEALNRRLPDVIVHWEDVAFGSPLQIKGCPFEFHRDGDRYLSQHTAEGFCILRTRDAAQIENAMPIKDLGELITRLVRGNCPTI